MSKFIIIAVIISVCIASVCFAQKVTVDPNRPGQAVQKPVDETTPYDPAKDPDKRMAKTVSYQAKHVRLSAVVADIVKLTGVTVICGRSTTDWQSRDVPVTVFAKDIPLGVLLRGLARGTHNTLRTQKTDTSYTYRIAQDTRLARQIGDFWTARENYCKTITSWSWDAAAALQDVPDAEFKLRGVDAKVSSEQTEFIKKMSQLLTALGPDYRSRVADGERLTLELSKVPSELQSPVKAVLAAADQVMLAYERPTVGIRPEARSTPLAPYELEKGSVVIYGPSSSAVDGFNPFLNTFASIPPSVPCITQNLSPTDVLTPESAKKRFGSPPKLSTPIEDDPQWDIDYRDPIDKAEGLKAKLDLSEFAESTENDIAEVYAAVAERAGYSIVIEDWWYLRSEYAGHSYDDVRFGGTPTWKKRFGSQDWKSIQPDKAFRDWGYYNLHLDARDKLIIGIDRAWSLRHLGLIPAALYDSIAKKLDGDGVYVDDLAPLLCLNPIQWQESVKHSRDLQAVVAHADWSKNPLWEFYAGLQSHEKAQAKSKEGLELAQYDPGALSSLLRRTCRAMQLGYESTPGLDKPERLTLHMKPVSEQMLREISSYRNEGPTKDYSDLGKRFIADKAVLRKIPGLTSHTTWQLSVRTIDKPDINVLAAPSVRQLPFYSDKRAAELAKDAIGPRK